MNYSPVTVAEIWERNGGSKSAVVSAVAVCAAESGYNPDAVSPALDYGLWQINIANFVNQGLTSSNWRDPDTNARVAIRMSGNGTNWAAWCTAWADPSNCGHGYVPTPQAGSPAGSHMDAVAAALGTFAGPTARATPTTHTASFTASWAQVQDFHGAYARRRAGTIQSLANLFGRFPS